MQTRFEIRTEKPNALALEYGQNYPLHIVWDNERARGVPFGRYRSRNRAEERLARERSKSEQQ